MASKPPQPPPVRGRGFSTCSKLLRLAAQVLTCSPSARITGAPVREPGLAAIRGQLGETDGAAGIGGSASVAERPGTEARACRAYLPLPRETPARPSRGARRARVFLGRDMVPLQWGVVVESMRTAPRCAPHRSTVWPLSAAQCGRGLLCKEATPPKRVLRDQWRLMMASGLAGIDVVVSSA